MYIYYVFKTFALDENYTKIYLKWKRNKNAKKKRKKKE